VPGAMLWVPLRKGGWEEGVSRHQLDYRKITFNNNKSLLAFKSALIVFTLKDAGCPPAPVLSSQLETGQ